ncbi:MauE/DoxX family redox-associated membrane protein [Verrucomicrobiaceae bacterium 227]
MERILRMGLGAFFIWSGILKLQDLQAFTESVGNFQIVGEPTDAVVAYLLPWVEIFAGLSVVSGIGKAGGLVIILGMLLVFNVAIAWVWSQGLNINCGCYGKGSEPTNYPLKLVANFGLMTLAGASLLLMWFQRRLASPDAGNTMKP